MSRKKHKLPLNLCPDNPYLHLHTPSARYCLCRILCPASPTPSLVGWTLAPSHVCIVLISWERRPCNNSICNEISGRYFTEGALNKLTALCFWGDRDHVI